MDGPVTEAEARVIIAKWSELHDLQAGLSAFIPFIARTGFYMEFAGKRWEGYEGLERHQIEKRRFFDERHETLEVRLMPAADAAHAWTLSHWDASYRPENSPRSRRIKTLIEQFRYPRLGPGQMWTRAAEFVEAGIGGDRPTKARSPRRR